MLETTLAKPARKMKWLRTMLRVQDRFAEVEGNVLANDLSLQLVKSLIPLIVIAIAVVGFVAGQQTDPATVLDQTQVSGQAKDVLSTMITTAAHSKNAASVVGLLGLLYSGLTVVNSIAMCVDSPWQATTRGLKEFLYGLAFVIVAGTLFALSFVGAAFVGNAEQVGELAPVLGVVPGLLMNFLLGLVTFKLMLNRKVPLKHHIPAAIFGAVGLELLKQFATLLLPRMVSSSSSLYGPVGALFGVLALFVFFGKLLVYMACLDVVIWESRYGTVTVDVRAPRMPGEAVPIGGTRGGLIPDPIQYEKEYEKRIQVGLEDDDLDDGYQAVGAHRQARNEAKRRRERERRAHKGEFHPSVSERIRRWMS